MVTQMPSFCIFYFNNFLYTVRTHKTDFMLYVLN